MHFCSSIIFPFPVLPFQRAEARLRGCFLPANITRINGGQLWPAFQEGVGLVRLHTFFQIKWVCGSWALSLKIASTRKLHYSKKWRSALGSAGPAFSHYDVISARLQGAWRHSLPGVTLSAQLCKPFFQREVLYSVHCTVSKYTLQEYTTSCYLQKTWSSHVFWFTGHRGEYNIN